MSNFPMRNLLTLIQKRFSSTSIGVSSSQLQDSSSFTVQYLINSCGLSSKSALSTSQKLTLDETKIQNPNSVLECLRSSGFDDTHITRLIEVRPKILRCRVENNLKPKLDYFVEKGCTGMLLAELVISNSGIIWRSLDCHIKPSFKFLKELLGSTDDVVKALKSCPWFFNVDLNQISKPIVDFLVGEGVPIHNLTKSIVSNPRILLQKRDDIVRDFHAVKELGLGPQDPNFCYALRVLVQTSENILSKKMEVYKSLGWTQQELLHIFRQKPICFTYSEKKIRNTMDYLVNTMMVERDYVIARPNLLTYSMDRLCRRYNILKALESNKLFKWDKRRVGSLITVNEKSFFKDFIAKYEKSVPGLLEIYSGTTMAEKFDV